MPYWHLLMLLFWMMFELLFVPRLVALTEVVPVPPMPMPMRVVVLALPTMLMLRIVLLVAPSVPLLCSQMTADVVPVFDSLIVRLRVVPLPLIAPLMRTRSAAFRRMNPPVGAVVLVMTRAVPVGKI